MQGVTLSHVLLKWLIDADTFFIFQVLQLEDIYWHNKDNMIISTLCRIQILFTLIGMYNFHYVHSHS